MYTNVTIEHRLMADFPSRTHLFVQDIFFPEKN